MESAGPSATAQELIFDTVVLNHFALAERLDVLSSLVAGRPCATTTVVLAELQEGAKQHPELARWTLASR